MGRGEETPGRTTSFLTDPVRAAAYTTPTLLPAAIPDGESSDDIYVNSSTVLSEIRPPLRKNSFLDVKSTGAAGAKAHQISERTVGDYTGVALYSEDPPPWIATIHQ